MIQVSQAFATAAEAWYDAVAIEAAGGAAEVTAAACWARLWHLGAYLGSREAVIAAANAVLAGDAVIFGGGFGGYLGGGATAGFASVGLVAGVGLTVAAAGAILICGFCIVKARNKRDMDATREDARFIYENAYLPRYAKWVQAIHRDERRLPLEPLTFEGFFENRTTKTTDPLHRQRFGTGAAGLW